MTARSLIEDIKSRLQSGGELDWKKAREELHAEHERATTSDDRSKLIALYVLIMDQVEKTAIDPTGLDKFREARTQDYNLFIVRESVVDGNASPPLLDAVTRREIAAGRMTPDHQLRKLAEVGSLIGDNLPPAKSSVSRGWLGGLSRIWRKD
jgi:hypothetical protein